MATHLARLRQSLLFPVLMKEMRTRMRGARTPALVLASAGTAVLVGIIILATANLDTGVDPTQKTEAMANTGRLLFTWMVGVEAVLAALMAPALTSGAISTEYERQTIELLLLTRLSGANIVLGKLFSSLSFLAVVLVAALPVTALAFVFGGISPLQLILSQLLIVALVLCFGAFGLWCSAHFHRTTTATVIAYTVCIAWVGLLPLLTVLFQWRNYFSSGGYFRGGNYLFDYMTSTLLAVGILMLVATVPTVAISGLIGILHEKRLARVTNFALWGGFASLALGVLYIPSVFNNLELEYFLFANPGVALYQVLRWETPEQIYYSPYASSSFSGGRLLALDWLSMSASILLMLLAAWGATALAVLRIHRHAYPRIKRRQKITEQPATTA